MKDYRNTGMKECRGKRVKMLLLFFLFAFLPFTATAQGYGLQWMHHPQADASQQIWFRQDLMLHDPPQQAHLSVASDGRYIVYVNGYHVSTDVFSSNPTGMIAMRDYDITRFLRQGDNVIGVWYAPVGTRGNAESWAADNRQLCVSMSGITADGHHFTVNPNKGWLCRVANARVTDYGETVDGTKYVSDWNRGSLNLMEWLPAEITYDGQSGGFQTNAKPVIQWKGTQGGFRVKRILKRAKVIQQGRTVIYNFGEPVHGWVRVTLRGLKKGEAVEVNGLRYIGTGKTDDQACRRFTTGDAGVARILLPAGRTASCISRVEAIEVSNE